MYQRIISIAVEGYRSKMANNMAMGQQIQTGQNRTNPYWPDTSTYKCLFTFLFRLLSSYLLILLSQCGSFSCSPQICQSVRPTCWSSIIFFRVWRSSTAPILLHLSRRCRFVLPSTLNGNLGHFKLGSKKFWTPVGHLGPQPRHGPQWLN